MIIPNKDTFLKLSKQGKLGNTFGYWDTSTGIPDSYKGFVTIRNTQKDSPFFVPNIHVDLLDEKVDELIKDGLDPTTIYYQEIPHETSCNNPKCNGCGRILNAEVMRDEKYIYLRYGTSPDLNLRSDLDLNGKALLSLESVLYLKSKYDCYEEIQKIWDEYPTSIIEFSVFNRKVGGQNKHTIIWEVRDY